MIKILVTGAGSTLGFIIISAIKSSKINALIFGADYIENSVGLFKVKKGYLLPDILKANVQEQNWISAIKKIIINEQIDLILIGLDFELKLFAKYKNELEKNSKVKVLVSSLDLINICTDKWLTYEFLKNNNFDVPRSCLPEKISNFYKTIPFPWIIKPRNGSTSKNLYKVLKLKDAEDALRKCPNPIIQEYVGTINEEFTCGTTFFNGEVKSSIALRRELKNGNISVAYHNKYPIIENYVKNVTKVLKPYGPINIQLRVEDHKIKIFEINPRLSGTTYIRCKFGLNEICIILNELFELNINPLNKSLKYGMVIRHFAEEFVSNKKINKIEQL